MSPVSSTRAMAANINEIRRTLPGRRSVVVIRQAKRDVVRRQERKDVSPVPARMPEFEAVAALLWEQLEKGAKPLRIRFKIRRELKQDWSGLPAQDGQPLFDQRQAVDRVVRQPLPMGDEFGGLPGEDEFIAALRGP